MKSIKEFRCEGDVLVLDLVDVEAAVVIDTTTGVLLLNEGTGDDRFHGAVIFPDDFVSLKVVDSNGDGKELRLEYGENDFHQLGTTTEIEAASRWIREANDVIRKHKHQSRPGDSSLREARTSANKSFRVPRATR